MKKLKLKLIGDNIVLSKEQMKKIGGGYVCECNVTIHCNYPGGEYAGEAATVEGAIDCGYQQDADYACISTYYYGAYATSCTCYRFC